MALCKPVSTRKGRLKRSRMPTTRDFGRLLIEEVQASLDNSEEGDRLRLLTEKMRRDFSLDEDLT